MTGRKVRWIIRIDWIYSSFTLLVGTSLSALEVDLVELDGCGQDVIPPSSYVLVTVQQ
jgi:hypothetical protein